MPKISRREMLKFATKASRERVARADEIVRKLRHNLAQERFKNRGLRRERDAGIRKQAAIIAGPQENVTALYAKLASGDVAGFYSYKWDEESMAKLETMVDFYTDGEKLVQYPTVEQKAIACQIELRTFYRWKNTELFAKMVTERIRKGALLGVVAALPAQAAIASDATLKGSTKAFTALAQVAGGLNRQEVKVDKTVKVTGLEGLLRGLKAKNITPGVKIIEADGGTEETA